MKWNAYGNQILVRPLLAVEKTSSGLVIPEDARGRPQRGVVLAAGPGAPSDSGVLLPMQCKVGDLILFGQYAGMPEVLDGQELLIMRDTEALAGLATGDYALTEHQDARGRTLVHMADETCELCAPKTDLSAERERLKAEGVIS